MFETLKLCNTVSNAEAFIATPFNITSVRFILAHEEVKLYLGQPI